MLVCTCTDAMQASYRINVFDRLVFADADVATGKVVSQQRMSANPLATLQLCTAAGSNDLEVRACIRYIVGVTLSA
jgi:hypothetical protein